MLIQRQRQRSRQNDSDTDADRQLLVLMKIVNGEIGNMIEMEKNYMKVLLVVNCCRSREF